MEKRKLNIYQYLEQLQLEYISADLRRKLFNREMDKNYWSKICELKKSKIQDIAERNSLPTIFNDEEVSRKTNELVFIGKHFPLFYYSSESMETRVKQWDYIHYYEVGALFRVLYAGEQQVCSLKTYTLYGSKAVFENIETKKEISVELFNAFRII